MLVPFVGPIAVLERESASYVDIGRGRLHAIPWRSSSALMRMICACKHWKRWGPHLSERAWGTVREDYSPDGTAWESLPTITPARKPIGGTRTAWRESAIATSSCVLHWRFGMGTIRFSKNGCSVSLATKGTTGRISREYYFYLDSTPRIPT